MQRILASPPEPACAPPCVRFASKIHPRSPSQFPLPREIRDQIRNEVDESICGETPEPFFAVGTWYSNFIQTTDAEVSHLLDRAAHERRVRRIQEQKERAFAS